MEAHSGCTGGNCRQLAADVASKSHFSNRFCNAARANWVHRFDFSCFVQFVQSIAVFLECAKIRREHVGVRRHHQEQVVAAFFERAGIDVLRRVMGNGERNKRVRNIQIFKGATHAVLAAN